MVAPTSTESTPVIADERERNVLAELQHALTACVSMPGSATLVLSDGERLDVPASAMKSLLQVVEMLANGDAVSLVPVHRELTTQEAADLLNISRQYLVRMLDRGDIPSHKVGTHRRVALDDVMAYRRKRDVERREGLAELTQLSQELGLYDRP
jgi:excisionase family DNA binding protein